MKLGRTISKKTPLARFAQKTGLSYKTIAECTDLSESTLKKAAAGISPLPAAAARAISDRFDVGLPYLMSTGKRGKMTHRDGREWALATIWIEGTSFGFSASDKVSAYADAIGAAARGVGVKIPANHDFELRLADCANKRGIFSGDLHTMINPEGYAEENRVLDLLERRWANRNRSLKKAAQISLRAYLHKRFEEALGAYSPEPRNDIMGLLADILSKGARHPQSPLIADEIIRKLMDVHSEYNLNRFENKPPPWKEVARPSKATAKTVDSLPNSIRTRTYGEGPPPKWLAKLMKEKQRSEVREKRKTRK